MNDEISRELKRRFGVFVNSPDFDVYFKRLHAFNHLQLVGLWMIMPFLLQGEASKVAWSKLTSGDARSSSLRRRYARLAEVGEVNFMYVLVCNASLTKEPGVDAPAMVIGNFNSGRDDGALLDLREKLADLSMGIGIEPRDRKVAKLLGDLDYRFKRRRHLPTSYTSGVEVTAFDLMILGDFLPSETLQIEAIPCVAEPGKRGLIAMIPYFLIEEVLREQSPDQ